MLEKLSVMDQSVHSLAFFIAFLNSFVNRGLKEVKWCFDVIRNLASNFGATSVIYRYVNSFGRALFFLSCLLLPNESNSAELSTVTNRDARKTFGHGPRCRQPRVC